VNEAKASLLIVEDDMDIAEMLNSYFCMQGYAVTTVNWGEDGVNKCLSDPPDLVLLDIRLPDIDGFEVARRLRGNRKTRDLPIIFLTEKRERTDRLQGLSLHAEDYITKPFDIQELRLRINNILERNHRITLTNPITGLPEGSLVDEFLQDYLNSADFSISVISLKNLGRFREVYGFVASDDLLRAVSLMLQDLLRSQGASDDFVGHLDPVNFVLVTRTANGIAMKELIHKRLTQSMDYFYRDQDRETDLFRGHRLAVEIYDFLPNSNPIKDTVKLRLELERLYR
jgi:PleD family two-component response regulator